MRIASGPLRDKHADVYVMNADGSRQVNLTKNPAADDIAPDCHLMGRELLSRLGEMEMLRSMS
jgi:hypothetical protein